MEDRLQYVERLMMEYGAVRVPEDGEKKFHLRGTYLFDGIYYRVEYDEFEEGGAIVLTATDDPEFARLGLGDNIAGFSVDTPENQIRQEIRCALGIQGFGGWKPPRTSTSQQR